MLIVKLLTEIRFQLSHLISQTAIIAHSLKETQAYWLTKCFTCISILCPVINMIDEWWSFILNFSQTISTVYLGTNQTLTWFGSIPKCNLFICWLQWLFYIPPLSGQDTKLHAGVGWYLRLVPPQDGTQILCSVLFCLCHIWLSTLHLWMAHNILFSAEKILTKHNRP